MERNTEKNYIEFEEKPWKILLWVILFLMLLTLGWVWSNNLRQGMMDKNPKWYYIYASSDHYSEDIYRTDFFAKKLDIFQKWWYIKSGKVPVGKEDVMQMEFTLEKERAIGYNLSRVLQEKKLTSEQLAERLACTQMRIKGILTGSVGVEERDLQEIAQVIGVDSSVLYTEPDEGIKDYNIHYMGTVTDQSALNDLLDDIDAYVRLLNTKTDR